MHEEVILTVLGIAEGIGLFPAALTFSPVKGPKGNIEYLLYLRMQKVGTVGVDAVSVRAVVAEAHATLDE